MMQKFYQADVYGKKASILPDKIDLMRKRLLEI